MGTTHGSVLFDGQAVQAIAGGLSGCADDADDEVRRALGALEFGARAAGSRYREPGTAIEDGYRRLRVACDRWIATVQTHADALRATAQRYAEHDAETADALARFDTIGAEPGIEPDCGSR